MLLERIKSEAAGLRYVYRLPAEMKEGEKYPAILFLHGAGTIGNDLDVVVNHRFFGYADRFAPGAAIFMPHCDGGLVWPDRYERLENFTEQVILGAPFVDPSRVYVMGNSMGGYATWQMAISMPHTFAAAVPICGGGMTWAAFRIKETPVWAFHGAKDRTVPCYESEHMVEALRAAGGNVRLTVNPKAAHDAWTPTFEDPAMWQWLFSQKRESVKTEENTENRFAGSQQFG